jgi:hypothetical protein
LLYKRRKNSVTTSGSVKQQAYALATLEFLQNTLSLQIDFTVDEFNALYEKSEVQGIGAKFGVAYNHVMDKFFIRGLIRNADIPNKDLYRDQLTHTIRLIGTHRFIADVLEKGNPDSDLVVYSKATLDKAMEKLAGGTETNKSVTTTTPKTKRKAQDAPKLNHPLEAVSAMREMRQLVDTVKISVLEFDEEKIRKSAIRPNGKVDYVMMTAQLRHNYTDYDTLRISRKIRRNTYWKLTARPAIRIAVCEKLLLMTENPALQFRLMQEIELANAEFQQKLTTLAKAPNFTAAIDDMFIRTTKRKVVKKTKCDFMLCLETL